MPPDPDPADAPRASPLRDQLAEALGRPSYVLPPGVQLLPRLRVLETSAGPVLVLDRMPHDLAEAVGQSQRIEVAGAFSDRPAPPPVLAFECEVHIPAVDPPPDLLVLGGRPAPTREDVAS